MGYLLSTNAEHFSAYRRNWGWFFAWGVLLVVLGFLAISAATFTTLVTVIFIGALIFAGGVVVGIDAFSFWRRHTGGFSLQLAVSILYLVVGLWLMVEPASSSISLTLILAIFYLIVGITRIIYALSIKTPLWGWALFNGIVTAILGLLIISQWPVSGLYIIGLFVGIDLLFFGWSYIMSALSVRGRAEV